MANKLASPFTILASAARTATATSSTFRMPPSARGLLVSLNATAITSTPGVTFQIEHYTGASGATLWGTVIVSGSVTAGTTLTSVIVHPDVPEIDNVSSQTAIKENFRVVTTHADSDSMTYSITAYPLA